MQIKKIEIEYLDTPENNKKLLEIQKEYKNKISKIPSVIKKIEELGFVFSSLNKYKKEIVVYSRNPKVFELLVSTNKDNSEEIICINCSYQEKIWLDRDEKIYFCNVIYTEQKENNILDIILYNGKKEKYIYRTEDIKSDIFQVLSSLLILESNPMEIGTIVRNLVR